MSLRGALIGAGNVALRGHAPQWLRPEIREQAEIVAVADMSPANRDAAHRLFPDATIYASADDLLQSEDVDFCDVCTPPFTRIPIVEEAASRGIHLLCEKP
ncbi:MAG TPA: Gfo/Idh/MocA family oxidoreductase, partial [Vicinamibacteria bacterium]|nr:Gfo/Idh/MocA family oxidoreductase [Vicinamibacteria bacterium]